MSAIIYEADFRFKILTGKDSSLGSLQFSKVSGIEYTMDYEEIMEGGKNDGPHILMVPHKKHQPLVLEHGVVNVQSWFHKLKPGMRLDTWLTIAATDSAGKIKYQYKIDDGIVTKWEIGGFDAMGNSVLVEKMEIVHDGINRS